MLSDGYKTIALEDKDHACSVQKFHGSGGFCFLQRRDSDREYAVCSAFLACQ